MADFRNFPICVFLVLNLVPFLAVPSAASSWDNYKLPPSLMKFKKRSKGTQPASAEDDLPWWHKNSKARKNEQSVEKRTCGKDCTGEAISPICAGVKQQKGVSHQFWSQCEHDNYILCNRYVGKLFYIIAHNFCSRTAPNQCMRHCKMEKQRPLCATGDPYNADYTYANRCFFEVGRCVARVNRGTRLRIKNRGACKVPNPHRFPSHFHRNWFIKMI